VGSDLKTIAGWIAETEAERARHEFCLRQPTAKAKGRMTEADIKAIVDRLADVAHILADTDTDTDPDDKAEIFRQLGLKLTYNPGEGLMRATIEPAGHWQFESVRGPTRNLRT
jgi:hypothetical protein